MIPVASYQNPAPGSREAHALKKAAQKKPSVVLNATGQDVQFYIVADRYLVRIDATGGQPYIGCNCLAALPPPEQDREESPCYHCGAVLLFIAEKEKEDV